MQIKILVEGGAMKPGPALSQKLGPAGINISEVISKVNESTKDFKGLKVPIELDVDMGTKQFEVQVFSPPTSELLKKELKVEKCTPDHKNQKVGNLSIEDVIKVTKVKYSGMLEKEFKSAVKSVLGTCTSIGTLVEGKDANELIEDVRLGKFDKEIDAKSTETNPEKRKELDDFFKNLKSEQEAKLAAEQKAAEEAEAAKAEEAAKEGEAVEGATPVEGKAAPAEEARPEEEKK